MNSSPYCSSSFTRKGERGGRDRTSSFTAPGTRSFAGNSSPKKKGGVPVGVPYSFFLLSQRE